ncbi:hypothetical protein ACKP2L_05595 [Oenococcus alcoholitolerans]|uniref:hypothetical protein n=1 Tax=Oenococcus alcoholitolerans TaxID=931074 RepID=UPI003F70E6B1
MYKNDTAFKTLVLFLKIIMAAGSFVLSASLINTALTNRSMIASDDNLMKISIYAALLTGSLNLLQAVCLFLDLSSILKKVYFASVILSNLLLIFIAYIWLATYSYLMFGIGLGIFNILLISTGLKKETK